MFEAVDFPFGLSTVEAASPKRFAYVPSAVPGGMGSFNDFVLDEGRFGAAAKHANRC